MPAFKRGDHVQWNSEAGLVRGVMVKKVTSDISIHGYTHHASNDKPQYLMQSDKTDHIAVHKPGALTLLSNRPQKAAKSSHKKRYSIFGIGVDRSHRHVDFP